MISALAVAMVMAHSTNPASAASSWQRIAGADRYDTARALAVAAFPGGVTTVVLASGTDYPDALSASYLAGRLHTTVLLTDPVVLSGAVLAALSELHASSVAVVGGPAAVADGVTQALSDAGFVVSRVYGTDRYATAAAVAQLYPGSFVGSIGGAGPTAVIASGGSFPDALAAGPLAYSASLPLLLTDPTMLSPATAQALTALSIQHVLLLGGAAAVSDQVANQLSGLGLTVQRVAGSDRGETAAAIAALTSSALGWAPAQAAIVTGDGFADALAAVGLASTGQAPLLLTDGGGTLGAGAQQFLSAHAATLQSLDVLGGTDAVPDSVAQAALQAAGG